MLSPERMAMENYSSNHDEDDMIDVETNAANIPPPALHAGASLPSVEEIRNTVQPVRSNSRKPLIWAAIGVVMVVVVIIGASVAATRGGGGGGASAPRQASFEEIKDFVITNSISSPETFDDLGSAQFLAAQWLSETDPANLAVPPGDISSADAYHYMTRYVLVVLYYETNGLQWRFNLNWMTERDVCFWNKPFFYTGSSDDIQLGSYCDASSGNIAHILLGFNFLQGQIPTEIGMLRTLKTLDLTENLMQGQIPDEVAELTGLQRLALSYNQLVGNLPANIGNMESLFGLYVSNNQLLGRLPDSMGQLSTLRFLYLDDNDFSGEITLFNQFTDLRFLIAEDNQLTGTLDDSFLANTPNISRIDLSNNDIQGRLPPALLAMPQLELIDLNNNRLSGQLPEFEVNNALKLLALHNNSLAGQIPTSISNLNATWHLDLAANQFSGSIPTEIGKMTILYRLSLADNNFSPGAIPETFADLKDLNELSLKNTQRSSGIPVWLGGLVNMTFLDLDSNLLTGVVPTELGQLAKLEYLLINNNLMIQGPVPIEIANATNLRAVFLEGTGLTGNLTDICASGHFTEDPNDLDGEEIIYADCEGDNSPIRCDCCVCCAVGVDCNNNDFVAHLDPIWERAYTRYTYEFSDETRFVDSDWLP